MIDDRTLIIIFVGVVVGSMATVLSGNIILGLLAGAAVAVTLKEVTNG